MKTITNNISALIISVAITVLALVLFVRVPTPVIGSVNTFNEYHSTTTSTGRFDSIAYLTGTTSQSGALGSVVVTGSGAGVINIYDATTTNVALRTGGLATSSILLATIPASAAANTYTFDALYYRGLIIETVGVMPTTTITYR